MRACERVLCVASLLRGGCPSKPPLPPRSPSTEPSDQSMPQHLFPASPPPPYPSSLSSRLAVLFFFCVGSVWEEYMFRSLPGFRFGWYLTFVQLVFMTCFAIAERAYYGEKAWRHEAPLARHGIVAGAMTASRGLTNVSLEYLNYPTQVVFKSLKLLTVMIGSVLFVGRRYSRLEYVAAVLTVTSAALFGLGDRDAAPQFSWVGIVVVLLSLVADSLHSNSQETLLQDHRATLRETMVFSNLFSAIGALTVCLLTSEFSVAFAYCARHPAAYIIMASHAVVNYLGVLCYVTSVKNFGVVLATTVTTVRKIVTVLLSFFIFPKPLNERYLYGLSLFFLAFMVQYYVQRQQVQQGLGIGHHAGQPSAASEGSGERASHGSVRARSSSELSKPGSPHTPFLHGGNGAVASGLVQVPLSVLPSVNGTAGTAGAPSRNRNGGPQLNLSSVPGFAGSGLAVDMAAASDTDSMV